MDNDEEKIYFSLNSPHKLLSEDTGGRAKNSYFANETVNIETTQDRSGCVWRACTRGKEYDSLFHPKGLTIDDSTGVIYVADCMNHRIQSFDKTGAFIKSLKSPLLTYPWGVKVNEDYLYITCCMADTNHLLKLNKGSGEELKRVSNEFWLAGLDTDSIGNVYACEMNHSIHLFDGTLDYKKQIKLDSVHFNEDTEVWDVKIDKDEFIYILCEESIYPVQLFDLKGKLVKCVVHQSEMSRGYFFHVNSDLKIFISDNGDSVVRVFDRRGYLIEVLERRDEATNENILKFPTGIALNSEGNIIICDDKPTQALQALIT